MPPSSQLIMYKGSKGLQAEYKLENEVKALGLTQPKRVPEGKLLALAKMVMPERVAMVEKHHHLGMLDSRDLLDYLYGLDLIVKTSEGYVGIDVTVDKGEFNPRNGEDLHLKRKRGKLDWLAPLHKALGVKRTVVYNPRKQSLKDCLGI